jgi:tRNA modification GTPase
VSPFAGTTRDIIEVHLDLAGYPVTLLDTAGIRPTDDPVEQEGVRRATERARAADIVLWIIDASVDRSTAERPVTDNPTWLVRNKIDLVDSEKKQLPDRSGTTFRVSATEGRGLDELLAALTSFARDYFDAGEPALITRERHRTALRDALGALERAIAEGPAGREDVIAEELRLAAQTFGRLTGRVDVEDILDVIFRDFCIGK